MAISDLDKYRKQMDELDESLVELLTKRMELSVQIAAYKSEKGLPIQDKKREAELLEARTKGAASQAMAKAIKTIYEGILAASREIQRETMK